MNATDRTDATNGTDGASQDAERERWMEELAEKCEAQDKPCEACQAGAPCDGWGLEDWVPEGDDAFEDRQYDDDEEDGLDECGMTEDEGCLKAGSEECEFRCPLRKTKRP